MAIFIIHPKKTSKNEWSICGSDPFPGPSTEIGYPKDQPWNHWATSQPWRNGWIVCLAQKLENPLARVWVPLPYGVDRKWQIYTETPQVMAGRKMRIHHWILAPLETNPYLGSSLGFDGAFLTIAMILQLFCGCGAVAPTHSWVGFGLPSCRRQSVDCPSQQSHLQGSQQTQLMWNTLPAHPWAYLGLRRSHHQHVDGPT